MWQESDLPDLRREVDDILQDWIGDLDIGVLEATGTLESRKRQVLDKIYKRKG